MNIVLIILTTAIVIAAILMILVVLVQKSKGGGLSSSFSGTNSVFGVKKATDGIEKITWGLAGFIIVMSIIAVSLTPRETSKPVITAPASQEQGLPDMTDIPPMPTTPSNEGSANE